jgi:hypothetical protein
MKIFTFCFVLLLSVVGYSENITNALNVMARELKSSGLFNRYESRYIDDVLRLARDYYADPNSIYMYRDLMGKTWIIRDYNDFIHIMENTFRYGLSKVRNNFSDIDTNQLRKLKLIK